MGGAGVLLIVAAAVAVVVRDRAHEPSPAYGPALSGGLAPAVDARGGAHQPTVASGQLSFEQACAMCHGVQGQGMPHQGPSLRDSAFVARSSDADLVALVRAGRLPTDPQSVMKLMMPPRGGSPTLSDADIVEIVHHMRAIQADARPSATAVTVRPGS
jgi:cytochrome c5